MHGQFRSGHVARVLDEGLPERLRWLPTFELHGVWLTRSGASFRQDEVTDLVAQITGDGDRLGWRVAVMVTDSGGGDDDRLGWRVAVTVTDSVAVTVTDSVAVTVTDSDCSVSPPGLRSAHR
jgi:hypothetical protein